MERLFDNFFFLWGGYVFISFYGGNIDDKIGFNFDFYIVIRSEECGGFVFCIVFIV